MDKELDFFQKMMLTNNIKFQNGRLFLMGREGVLINMGIFAAVQKNQIESDPKVILDSSYIIFSEITKNYKERFTNDQYKDLINSIIAASGFGLIKVEFENNKAYAFLSPSVFAEKYAEMYGLQKLPVCYFTAGGIKSMMDWFYEKQGDIQEAECVAMGKNRCTFVYTAT